MKVCIYCRNDIKKESSFDVLTSSVIVSITKNSQLATIWVNQQRNKGERAKYSKVYFCGNCYSLYIPSPQVPQDKH